eukprot:3954833-Pleurochrysis_carterae.AAC.1
MIVYQDFGSGSCDVPEFGACAPRLGRNAISPLMERARAEAVVCSADTVGVTNNDAAAFSCVSLGVCGGRPPSMLGSNLISAAFSAESWVPSSVSSVCSPWSSTASASMAGSAGLTDVNRKSMPLTSTVSFP